MGEKTFWDKEKVVKETDLNAKNKIIVKKVSKSNKEYIDVRKYYLDKEGNWAPGKGIAIPDELADELADILYDSNKIKL